MNIELVGFIIGMIGALWIKVSINLMNQRPTHPELDRSIGRDPDNPALKAFVRGLVWVLFGLGLETYARLFS